MAQTKSLLYLVEWAFLLYRKMRPIKELLESNMNYAGIKYCDIANGLGCRTVLFVSGCRNHCRDCFQPQTWDFSYGDPFDEQVQQEILDSLAPGYVQGLTLLGGEPFEPENQKALVPFVEKVKKQYPGKNIWAFTGYIYDKDLIPGGRKYTEDTDRLLNMIDVLVDGPFVAEEKDIRLKFRGSKNQRVIDLQKTRKDGKIILFME
jgi:anaerobic ribonucleoside-triphosphate reductase activating protein